MVRRFYAVTTTSIYCVDAGTVKTGGRPVATKIALRGESELKIGAALEGGTMLAITTCLQMYIPEGGGITSFKREIEGVNTRYWFGHSSDIVALFSNEKAARECFSKSDLVTCDPRWLNSTREVLDRIGDKHPNFYVCKWGNLNLLQTSDA